MGQPAFGGGLQLQEPPRCLREPLERALEQEAALGMPPSYHASEAGLARALERRNAEGDVERARSLWESAERGYRQLGAQLPARFRQRVPKTSVI